MLTTKPLLTISGVLVTLTVIASAIAPTAYAQQLKPKTESTPWAGCCTSCSHNGGWTCTGCSEAVGGECGINTIKATCATSYDTTLCTPTPKTKTKDLKVK